MSMAEWTHAICSECYEREGEGAGVPHCLTAVERAERCCWCGQMTTSGIYLRRDPLWVKCRGQHEA